MVFWSEPTKTPANDAPKARKTSSDASLELRGRLHQRLLDMLNLSALEHTPRETLAAEIRRAITGLLADEKRLLSPAQTDLLVEELLDELLGLGPLEPLLADESITDILINTHEHVYVERKGRLELTDVRFLDTRHLVRIVNKIVSAVGRRVDESSPMVDARLADGSRVNAIIPPLAVDGPLVSIRKFAKIPINMGKLVEIGSITGEMAMVLQACVEARRNVLISGGTGSGKTTLLNALSAYIDPTERIVTIEDSAELQLQQPHVGRLETRPSNIEGRGEISQRDLVKNSLRMRPDRIIVGEVRSGEAFDMLQAMNTGHDGSMTTVHANNPRDAVRRVENMVSMAGLNFPVVAIRQQMASAINLMVHVARLTGGRRKVTNIAEVTGMEGEAFCLQDLFRFKQTSVDAEGHAIGHFEACGVRPQLLERIQSEGVELPLEMFRQRVLSSGRART